MHFCTICTGTCGLISTVNRGGQHPLEMSGWNFMRSGVIVPYQTQAGGSEMDFPQGHVVRRKLRLKFTESRRFFFGRQVQNDCAITMNQKLDSLCTFGFQFIRGMMWQCWHTLLKWSLSMQYSGCAVPSSQISSSSSSNCIMQNLEKGTPQGGNQGACLLRAWELQLWGHSFHDILTDALVKSVQAFEASNLRFGLSLEWAVRNSDQDNIDGIHQQRR